MAFAPLAGGCVGAQEEHTECCGDDKDERDNEGDTPSLR